MIFTAKRAAISTVVAVAFSLTPRAMAEPTPPVRRPQVPVELKQWLYPGASCFASVKNAPMVMAQFTTSVPVREVALFYRKKVSRGKYYQGSLYEDEVGWADHTNGGSGGINAMMGGGKRVDNPSISNCLYFVRTKRQVITIQVRYIDAEKSTQITLFSSQR